MMEEDLLCGIRKKAIRLKMPEGWCYLWCGLIRCLGKVFKKGKAEVTDLCHRNQIFI